MPYTKLQALSGKEGLIAVIEEGTTLKNGSVTLQHAENIAEQGGSGPWDQLQIIDGRVYYHEAGERTIPLKTLTPEELRAYAADAVVLKDKETRPRIDLDEYDAGRGFFERAHAEFVAAKADGFKNLY